MVRTRITKRLALHRTGGCSAFHLGFDARRHASPLAVPIWTHLPVTRSFGDPPFLPHQ